MPTYKMTSRKDFDKLCEIRRVAMEKGTLYCISSKPEHNCEPFQSENIVLVTYDIQFNSALQTILAELFDQYGPGPYGMDPNTSREEFTQIKLGTCICGYSDF